MHYLSNLERFKIYTKIHKYRSYMFRSSTIIRKLALGMAEVILKHSVKFYEVNICVNFSVNLSKFNK
jgi:hypothetical protein